MKGDTDLMLLQTRMFFFIWVLLLCSLGGRAATGESRTHCSGAYCVTLNEGEITSEAGLCVVIPCSFYTPSFFRTNVLIWYKCEASKRLCSASDIIFHSNKEREIQAGFTGRVSLLERDLSRNNCSIIINDLKESDSGSYQLRLNGQSDRFHFVQRSSVSVKGLSQRPTVKVPPLTDGQQATLTCTAPALCSGSSPNIYWTWRGGGGTNVHLAGSSSVETVSAVTTHSSALTFTSSAEHHGHLLTCTVTFRGGATTEETVTLNVTYVKEIEIIGKTDVIEGETLNLTCSVESVPQSFVTWTKTSLLNIFENEKYTQEGSGVATLFIPQVTAEHAGQYICTVKHLDTTLRKEADVVVTYVKEIEIIGKTDVIEGETLNLTCSAESVPQSFVNWVKFSPENLEKGHETFPQSNSEHMQEGSGMDTLLVFNVTAEHAGQYICTVKHLDTTLMKEANVSVIYVRTATIIGNTTIKQGDTLELTCSIESFPPARITWRGPNPTSGLTNDTWTGSLVIPNATAQHSGRYICTAEHPIATQTTHADVTVTWFKGILNGSGCETDGAAVACVCVSQGAPLPTITWPLLDNHTKYSVLTAVSKSIVTSNVTLIVQNHSYTFVECVSSHTNGVAKEVFEVHMLKKDHHTYSKEDRTFFQNVSWPEVVTAFVIGVLLASALCCLTKCLRREKSVDVNETVEMVTSLEDEQIYADPALEYDHIRQQEEAKTENGAAGPTGVEYASIDFSALRRKSVRRADVPKESTETEYSEIKREAQAKRPDSTVEPAEVSENQLELVMTVEDEEMTVPEEEEEEEQEDMALYSRRRSDDSVCCDYNVMDAPSDE